MLSTQKEKKDLIRKLIEERHSYRDIAKLAHCSPNEIARVKRERMTETDTNLKGKSVCSRVFDSLQKEFHLLKLL